MVLQATRRQDSENTPPTARLTASKSHGRSGILGLSARRHRARTTGGANHPRYTVVQAKRRSTTRTPTSIKFDVPGVLRTPTSASSFIDVTMKESSPSVSPNASVSLPRYLSRPDYRDISEDKLVALDAELAGTPLDYIHDGLEAIGPDMIRALSNVKAQPVRNNLPKELSIVVDDMSRYMPTHMLAVYARQSSATRRRVTLFPVHNIILAAHCANLPQLPESNPSAPDVPGSSISVPVVPLCIPAPETFPHLSAFLYTKRVDHLLSSLLPCPAPPSLYREEPMESGNPELVQFATKLSSMYTAQALLSRAMLVNGLWRNVCALGIFDERLWGAMDVAWEVLLTAMAIATGKPQMILGTQSS